MRDNPKQQPQDLVYKYFEISLALSPLATYYVNVRQRAAARVRVGGFSSPGKMPCSSWSIPAKACKVGSILRSVEGSTCSKCYARKGRYVFPVVQTALDRRLRAYLMNPRAWSMDMIQALEGETHFRWFDSGDLQDLQMLEEIALIAQARPEVSFWLPTKEAYLVSKYLGKWGAFPSNLVVRISLPMVEQMPKDIRHSIPMAGVSKHSKNVTCPSSTQGGKCLDCRKCWSREDVVYAAH